MGLLDSIVGRSFRDEQSGRVVVFTGDRRHRGYVVKSESDELKIRSFLKMFYFAHFSILLLGIMLANAWSTFFANLHEFGAPAAHILRTSGIYLGIYSVVVGLPYFLLWRSYKKALSGFVSAQDEVLISGKSPGPQPWIALAGLTVLLLAGLMLFYLVRAK
jgi:uncharacterized protein YjeT (DUF2065 family)